MHRFHISPGFNLEDLVTLDAKESHHALSVLRVKPGEVVELLDGQGGSFQGIIAGTEKGRVQVAIRAVSETQTASSVRLTLAASVIKPERMEWMVQKACELGAAAIVPLISERTVVRLSRERWKGKVERWQKIASQTCKQCGQATEPKIQEVAEFKKFAAALAPYDLTLIPTLAVPAPSLYHSLNANKSAQSVLVLIGPEGDFSPNEVKQALASGAQAVSLGPLVMRSETAALYALSASRFFYGI
jgi:16S rRNA (uracil1498-N3)-methyltransferase